MNKEIIENIKIMANYLDLSLVGITVDCWQPWEFKEYIVSKVGLAKYNKMCYEKDTHHMTLDVNRRLVKWYSWSTSYHNGDSYDEDQIEFVLDSEPMLIRLESELYKRCESKAATKAMEQLKTKITLDELSRVGIKKGW